MDFAIGCKNSVGMSILFWFVVGMLVFAVWSASDGRLMPALISFVIALLLVVIAVAVIRSEIERANA